MAPIVNQQLLVLLVRFRMYKLIPSERLYHLVFDSTDASLSMIPDIDSKLERSFTWSPVPVRTADGKYHELFLIARDHWSLRFEENRLCICTPATRTSSTSDDSPWEVTEARPIHMLSRPFSANVMFSFKGNVFWGDLTQGLAYCNLTAARGGAWKFDFIELPKAYQVDLFELDGRHEEPQQSRTMGCAGDSIKFICIDRNNPLPGNEMVKVWTLDLDHRRWTESMCIPCKGLEKKVDGFVQAELVDIVPQFPTLMADGTLCLLLGSKGGGPKGTYYSICSLEMGSKSLVSAGCVVNCHIKPFVMPYNFFKMCSPPTCKKKLPKHAPELSTRKKFRTHNMKLRTIMKEKPKHSASGIQ